MILLAVVVAIVMLIEIGGMLLINIREVKNKLAIKKYSVIILIGNTLLMLLSYYKEINGGKVAYWYFCLFSYLLCLTIYDIKFKELPDWWHVLPILCYIGYWAGGVQTVTLAESGFVVIIVAAILGLIYLLRKDSIGVGDIKLLLVCAVYAGRSSGGMIVRGMVAAFVFSLVLLLLKKVTAKSELPFVPFLLLGALAM